MTTLYASFAPYQNYDEPGTTDRIFIDTFDKLPCCIVSGDVTVRLKPNPGIPDNDAINFLWVDSGGNLMAPTWGSFIGNPPNPNSILPNTWNNTNYPAGATLNLDLAALPTPSGPVNRIPTVRQLKFMDVLVQDDTNVDYIDLRVTTGLDGDIDGDGCVDAQDFLLLSTYFGQPVPNGVGDPNGDGILNAADLNLVAADFGRCCPEPGSCALLFVGCIGLLGVSRSRIGG
jgi:hypothetical protein